MSGLELPHDRVEFHLLAVRSDHADWVVGRVETGEFVVLPETGMTIPRQLQTGKSIYKVSDVVGLLSACYAAGYVEDVASENATSFTDDQRERYSRSQRFFQ